MMGIKQMENIGREDLMISLFGLNDAKLLNLAMDCAYCAWFDNNETSLAMALKAVNSIASKHNYSIYWHGNDKVSPCGDQWSISKKKILLARVYC